MEHVPSRLPCPRPSSPRSSAWLCSVLSLRSSPHPPCQKGDFQDEEDWEAHETIGPDMAHTSEHLTLGVWKCTPAVQLGGPIPEAPMTRGFWVVEFHHDFFGNFSEPSSFRKISFLVSFAKSSIFLLSQH